MQSLPALQAELLQPAPEKAGAYGRKADIVTGVQAELSKVVEAGAADAQKKFAALVESAAKNAPAGSEQAVAMAKAAFAAANDAFGNAQKAAKAGCRGRRGQHRQVQRRHQAGGQSRRAA